MHNTQCHIIYNILHILYEKDCPPPRFSAAAGNRNSNLRSGIGTARILLRKQVLCAVERVEKAGKTGIRHCMHERADDLFLSAARFQRAFDV